MSSPPEQSPQQRQIRVFVSSTFRDMHAEREELVKRVFPQLRKLCDQRGVIWSDVDLRWGVTEEQKAEGHALSICLAEIERCRPYFVGLLGERYGPSVERIHPDVLATEVWLRNHLDRSLTEMEIMHGVLRDPAMAEHAFFYFRDPAYLDRLPTGTNPDDFRSENSDQAELLRQLKKSIRSSGFPVRENYSDPKVLGQLVLADFISLIDRLYPEGSQPNSLVREAMDQEFYATTRERAYIRRHADFDKLDQHAEGKGAPLVVLGESGLGKSALLANWALDRRKRNPETPLLLHFVGSTPDSADWIGMVRRILGELQRLFSLKLEIPDQPDSLRAVFANALHMVAAHGRVVVVLDALNQLEDRDGAPDLVWLPPVIPDNVRLILSTLPGRPLDDLRKRGWPSITVEPLRVEERKQLIADYLAQYAKVLSRPHAEQIATAEQTANPLYLRALLEELRVFGDHSQLDYRIGHYLGARSVPELFERILTRWEEDFEGDRAGLVGETMSLIWGSRRGLSEAELLDLLGNDGVPLPRVYWSPLSLAAETSLMSRSGLIGFVHEFVRAAVEKRYAPDAATQRDLHLRLADYFMLQNAVRRRLDELPWQLQQGRGWQRLARLLTDSEFLVLAWHMDQHAVKTYWASLEGESQWRMAEVYGPIVSQPVTSSTISSTKSAELLLSQSGHSDLAYQASVQILEFHRATADLPGLAESMANQATHLRLMGNLQESFSLHQQQEELCRSLDDKDGLQNALGNQAIILRIWGRLEEALARHKEEERICRELLNYEALQACLGNQGILWADLGQIDRSLALHNEEESLCRILGDVEGVARSRGNQGILLKALGRPDEAMAAFQEKEKISRGVGDKRGVQSALGSQATIFIDKDEFQKALALLKQQEAICVEFGIADGLQAAIGNQAIGNKLLGNLDESKRLYGRQELLCRQTGDIKNLVVVLNNTALLELERGFPDEAIRMCQDARQIAIEHGYRSLLLRIDENLARIRSTRADLATVGRSSDAKCDTCSNATPRSATNRIANRQFREAVIKGFNPFLMPNAILPATLSRMLATGGDRQAMAEKWREKALADTTDWVLCQKCMRVFSEF